MVSILDIARVSKAVPVKTKPNGHIEDAEIEVFGISARTIARLIARFPEVRKMWDQGALDVPTLCEAIPEAAGIVIASGTGHEGDAQYEEAAAALPLYVQIDLVAGIADLTMPGGLGPLVEKWNRLVGGAAGSMPNLPGDGGASAMAPDTTSQLPLSS